MLHFIFQEYLNDAQINENNRGIQMNSQSYNGKPFYLKEKVPSIADD